MVKRKKLPFLSRPKDRSLESFKAWMTEITKQMGAKGEVSDEKWVELHRRFWDKNDAAEKAKSEEDKNESS